MLNVCTGNGTHDAITHEGHTCPLCLALTEKIQAEDRLERMTEDRDRLQDLVEKMTS